MEYQGISFNVGSGVFRKTRKQEVLDRMVHKVPLDVVSKTGFDRYCIVEECDTYSTLMIKRYSEKRDFVWLSKLRNIATNVRRTDKESTGIGYDCLCVEVIIKDEQGTLGAYYRIKPHSIDECIFKGSSNAFFDGIGLSTNWAWLPKYIAAKLKEYSWLQLSCIQLMLCINMPEWSKGDIRCYRGLSKEKELLHRVNNLTYNTFEEFLENRIEYCPEGEYTLAEIITIG